MVSTAGREMRDGPGFSTMCERPVVTVPATTIFGRRDAASSSSWPVTGGIRGVGDGIALISQRPHAQVVGLNLGST